MSDYETYFFKDRKCEVCGKIIPTIQSCLLLVKKVTATEYSNLHTEIAPIHLDCRRDGDMIVQTESKLLDKNL